MHCVEKALRELILLCGTAGEAHVLWHKGGGHFFGLHSRRVSDNISPMRRTVPIFLLLYLLASYFFLLSLVYFT